MFVQRRLAVFRVVLSYERHFVVVVVVVVVVVIAVVVLLAKLK